MSDPLPFEKVFAEHNGFGDDFPGFLLVNHGHSETADQVQLARVYADVALQSIDYGLSKLDTPEAAYPGLFMARHALELYLKGIVPDWDNLRSGKNRHAIDYLVDILRDRLKQEYDDEEVDPFYRFLKQLYMIDPKSMAFRFQNGARLSFREDPLEDPEIWINFVELRKSLSKTFDALDKVWRQSQTSLSGS